MNSQFTVEMNGGDRTNNYANKSGIRAAQDCHEEIAFVKRGNDYNMK